MPRETVISLRRRLPGASSGLTRERHAGRASPDRETGIALLFGLAPGGVYRAGVVTHAAGELLPHRFTLTAPFPRRRFAFCGTGPWGCPPWPLASTLPCGARTFLPRELPHAGDHPAFSGANQRAWGSGGKYRTRRQSSTGAGYSSTTHVLDSRDALFCDGGCGVRRKQARIDPWPCFGRVASRIRESPRRDSAQATGDLSNFLGSVLLGQRRTGQQVLAHGEAADEARLEPHAADDPLGEGDGLRIVAGDRHADQTARAVGDLAHPPLADRVERAHDARPRHQLGAG